MNIMTTLLVHVDKTLLSPEFQMWQMNHKKTHSILNFQNNPKDILVN